MSVDTDGGVTEGGVTGDLLTLGEKILESGRVICMLDRRVAVSDTELLILDELNVSWSVDDRLDLLLLKLSEENATMVEEERSLIYRTKRNGKNLF